MSRHLRTCGITVFAGAIRAPGSSRAALVALPIAPTLAGCHGDEGDQRAARGERVVLALDPRNEWASRSTSQLGPFWRYYRDRDPGLAAIPNAPEFKARFTEIERDMARRRAELAARPKDAPPDLANVRWLLALSHGRIDWGRHGSDTGGRRS